MKRLLFVLCFLLVAPAFAQQQTAPEIPFRSVPDFLKLPPNMYIGEVSGVAVNSKGHVFVFTRGNTNGPAYAAAAAQLLEFDANGKYLREIGHNLYAWSFAHTVKIDKEDNIWVTDKGSDMVIKFNPEGRVVMVFGRKQEASDEGTGPLKHPKPPLPPVDGQFRQVTDVAWDAAGNTYISDGYINSRVAKVDKDGNWLKSWGTPGDQPGQFNTPHSIATDAQGHVYVADRGNRRIQVFDGDGTFIRQMTIDVPVPPDARPAIGNKPGPDVTGTHSARRALGHLHHAGTQPVFVQFGRLSGPHLQAQPRWQGAGIPRKRGQATQTIRLDSRNGVSVGERTFCRRASELARAEADSRADQHCKSALKAAERVWAVLAAHKDIETGSIQNLGGV